MKKVVFAAVVAMLLAAAGIVAHNDGPQFEARLTGAEEVPPVTTETVGKVEIRFNEDETKAEFELEVRKGVRVTQAHIHCAAKGVNGPVVVFLAGFHNRGWDVDGSWVENTTVTDANVMPPSSPACPHVITNLRDLVQAIRQGNTYANVHTVANPGGEVRGQLKEEVDE
jgi:CHRD domain